jgi:hypothetical protein
MTWGGFCISNINASHNINIEKKVNVKEEESNGQVPF